MMLRCVHCPIPFSNLIIHLVVYVVVWMTARAWVQARGHHTSSAIDNTAGAASRAHDGELAPPLPGPGPPAPSSPAALSPGGHVRPRPVHVMVRMACLVCTYDHSKRCTCTSFLFDGWGSMAQSEAVGVNPGARCCIAAPRVGIN